MTVPARYLRLSNTRRRRSCSLPCCHCCDASRPLSQPALPPPFVCDASSDELPLLPLPPRPCYRRSFLMRRGRNCQAGGQRNGPDVLVQRWSCKHRTGWSRWPPNSIVSRLDPFRKSLKPSKSTANLRAHQFLSVHGHCKWPNLELDGVSVLRSAAFEQLLQISQFGPLFGSASPNPFSDAFPPTWIMSFPMSLRPLRLMGERVDFSVRAVRQP